LSVTEFVNRFFYDILISSCICRGVFEQTLRHFRLGGGQRPTRRREQCRSVGCQRRWDQQGRSCQGSCFYSDLLPAIHVRVTNGLSWQGKKGEKIGYLNIIYCMQRIIIYNTTYYYISLSNKIIYILYMHLAQDDHALRGRWLDDKLSIFFWYI